MHGQEFRIQLHAETGSIWFVALDGSEDQADQSQEKSYQTHDPDQAQDES